MKDEIEWKKIIYLTQDNINYKIATARVNGRLDIAIRDETRKTQPICEQNFSLKELKKINMIFYIPLNIDEAKFAIEKALNQNQVKIEKKNDEYTDLNFISGLFDKKESPFVLRLPKRKIKCPAEDDKIKELEKRKEELKKKQEELKKEIYLLKSGERNFSQKRRMMDGKKGEILQKNEELIDDNEELKAKISKLKKKNESLKKDIRKLKERKNELTERISKELSQPLYNSNIFGQRDSFEEEKEYNFNVSMSYGKIIRTPEELELLTGKIGGYLKRVKLNIIYKATMDSDNAKIFHKKCDKYQKTLVLVESKRGARFGGYTSQSWGGTGVKDDPDAFIFSLNDMIRYDIPKGHSAITCNPLSGPIFSDGIINIYDNALNMGGSTIEGFKAMENYQLTKGEKQFDVEDIEVYNVIV